MKVKNGMDNQLNVALFLFTEKMRDRLEQKERAGYIGWNDRSMITDEQLYVRALTSLRDGRFVDAANLAMMLQHRQEKNADVA